MLLFGKDTEKEIVVVAEVGMNHEGSVDWILEMLPKIKEAGADAVKFQLFTPNLFISSSNPKRFEIVKKMALSKSQFEEIYSFCVNLDLNVFATAVSHDWVSYISHKCGVVKIASGDFVFSPTIDSALKSDAKIIVSTGASSREEIVQFSQKAKQIRSGNYYSESIAILHCISSYPPKLEQANLHAISDIRNLTGLTVGFSSHFLEDSPIYASLALGARVFEIHVTDDRSKLSFRDHALSRTPIELKLLISSLRQIDKSLKSKVKTVQKDEQEIQLSIRKGPIYSRFLNEGDVIRESDISYARPASSEFSSTVEIIGRRLKQSVAEGESIHSSHFLEFTGN